MPGAKQKIDPQIAQVRDSLVVMKGKGPSVENVAHYVFDHVVELIRRQYPDRGLDYRIEVTIQETENNFFIVEKTATV